MLAIIHCRIMHGGALNVLQDLIQQKKYQKYHHIIIFTLFRDHKNIPRSTFPANTQIITSFPSRLNTFIVQISPKIPGIRKLLDYRNFMVSFPLMTRLLSWKIKQYQYDEVLVSSFAVAKNVHFNTKKPSTLYLHSPMQYIWTHYEEYCQKFSGIMVQLYKQVTKYLRKWDIQKRTFDHIVCNSKYTRQCAHKIYGWNVNNMIVQYPKIDEIFTTLPQQHTHDYYIYVGRIAKLVKEVDLVINMCNHTHTNLLIIGDGPDMQYCKKIAGPTITFAGRVKDQYELATLIARSRGLINLTKESYGIVTAQAIALDIPVFAYAEGGSAELVTAGKGIVVKNKNMDNIVEKFKKFKKIY